MAPQHHPPERDMKHLVLVLSAAALVAGAVVTHDASRSVAFASGDDGKGVYAANCIGCHGATGAGLPSTFPPLAKNAFVTGDPKKVIRAVLAGMSGPIKVNGKPYNGSMPPWKGTLSNKAVAAVISYIRSSWGNKASAVTEKQVASSK
jgi:mono/diheme cytochrome c family protein